MSFSNSSDPDAIFGRTRDLLGAEGFNRLRRARVAVFGLGGVGSHAAMALARSGAGFLRLIDIDKVSATSLNRSAFARFQDIGLPKVQALKEAIEAISPRTEVEIHQQFFHEDTAEALLAGPPDYVIDAIDSFTPKVALLRFCVERHIPVVSCMGASARSDPAHLKIGDISETRICPLARVVRQKLARLGIREGITAVYSTEKPLAPLPPDDSEEVVYKRGRPRRRLPSLIVMPGVIGYTAAGIVIAELAGANNEA